MILIVSHDSTLDPGRPQTASLQDAIDQVHEAGGGTVFVEPGCYVTTTLFLRSGVELHLQRGAIIQAHHHLDDYPEVEAAANNKDQTAYHLIVARNCEHVTISGPGVIDGQDDVFWTPCDSPDQWPYGIFRFIAKTRPSPLIQLIGVRHLTIRDITIRRAPGWALHVYECDHVSVHGITLRGHRFGPNTDGIGINSSRDVRVAHCDVDTGDDAIIIKATNPESMCERVTVTNCVVSSNCAALGLGADVYGVIRDVVFSNCVVNQSLRMIQVEMWFTGTIERAIFTGITGRTYPDQGVLNERPIYVDIQQFLRPEPELGKVRDIIFRDILCESRGRIMMTAQDGSVIDGVTLDTVTVNVPEIEDPAEVVPPATSWQLSNHSPKTRAVRAAVIADNVHRLTMRDVEYRWPENASPSMHALCLRRTPDPVMDTPRLSATDAATPHTLEIE